jgi:hypothetical protein
VLAGAPALLAEAQNLLGDAALKKDAVIKAMAGEWTGLAATVPALVAAVSKRVAMLEKSKHQAAGVDLAAAKTNMADATAMWSKAQAAFAANNVEEAVTSARSVFQTQEARLRPWVSRCPGPWVWPGPPRGVAQGATASMRSTVRQPRGSTAPRWARSPR